MGNDAYNFYNDGGTLKKSDYKLHPEADATNPLFLEDNQSEEDTPTVASQFRQLQYGDPAALIRAAVDAGLIERRSVPGYQEHKFPLAG